MSVVQRRTVVGSGDWCRLVTTTDNSPSKDYTHPDGQTTLLHVTPGFQPFTVIIIMITMVMTIKRN